MGAYFDIGCKPLMNNYGERTLSLVLNRQASDALEYLIDETLQEQYPQLHENIMEVLVLDQISFADLNKNDFNTVVKVIRDCLKNRNNPSEGQLMQKRIWETQIEPLVQQDERYEDPS